MSCQEICRMLAEIQGVDEEVIAPDARLWGAISVMDLAALVMACERRFKIAIEDSDAPDFQRVRDLAGYVDALVRDGREDYRAPSDAQRAAWHYE